MKKNYIQPSIKAYKIHSASILAGSTVSSGGSNNVSGGPVTAESKSNNLWGWGDNEE